MLADIAAAWARAADLLHAHRALAEEGRLTAADLRMWQQWPLQGLVTERVATGS